MCLLILHSFKDLTETKVNSGLAVIRLVCFDVFTPSCGFYVQSSTSPRFKGHPQVLIFCYYTIMSYLWHILYVSDV